jgi:alkylation response protein AidB-like acyl-CoA dehydrogenase
MRGERGRRVFASDIAARSDEEIRDAVTGWLRENLPAGWVQAIDDGDAAALAVARQGLDIDDWWERLGEAGWYFSNWPVAYGGLGLAPEQTASVNDVLRSYKVPRSDNPLGLNVAHALLRWGSEAQKSRFLPLISNQKEIWVQLFSEPGAGSDLAGLSTRAVRDGDVWVINGQKIWSSHAHRAQFGFLLCRTDPDVPKRQGLSVLLLDMSTPGITVRPLKQMTGESRFNEVFFDDVVCGDAMRVGELGEGWQIASQLLAFERGTGGGGGTAPPGMEMGRSVDALRRHYGSVEDPIMLERMALAYSLERVAAWTRERVQASRKAGKSNGFEASLLKLFNSDNAQALQTLSLDLEGLNGIAHRPDDRWAGASAYAFLRVRSQTIAGGSSEMQHNILGERVLGLPREPSADGGIPWRDIRRS